MKKTILVLVAMALLSACTTNGVYDGKKTALFVGSIIVVGAISANGSGSSGPAASDPNCPINPFPGDPSIGTPCGP